MKKSLIFKVLLALTVTFVLAVPFSVAAHHKDGHEGGPTKGNADQSEKIENADETEEEIETETEDGNLEEVESEDTSESEDDVNKSNDQRSKRDQLKEERKAWKDSLKEAKKESQEKFKEEREQIKLQISDQSVSLEEEGDIEGAYEVQEDLVALDLKDKASYKNLGELFDKKRGHSGKKVFVNGKHPHFDTPPVIRDGRTLIPLRAVSNALNAEVEWNDEERKVTLVRDDVTIELYIGENVVYVNGEEMTIDVPADIENSRTIVPLRFIGEAFDAYVDWEEESESVIIVDEEEVVEDAEAVDGVAEETTDESETPTEETISTEEDEVQEDLNPEVGTEETDETIAIE